MSRIDTFEKVAAEAPHRAIGLSSINRSAPGHTRRFGQDSAHQK